MNETELLRLLIDEVPAAIAMFDRDMRYIAASKRWIEAYLPGVPAPVGRCHYDIFPECPERWRADHRRGLAGENVNVAKDSWTLPDGTQLWMRYEVRPWHSSDGQIGGILIITEDITERQRAEDTQRESLTRIEREHDRLQLILDTLPVGLYILNADGGVAISNELQQRIWAGSAPLTSVQDYDKYKGFSPTTGKRLEPEDWPAAQALLFGRRIEGEMVDIERFDGERGTLLFSAAPIRREGGVIDGAVVAVQDVTELRAAQARLEEADRQKNQFLAVLSHELRNPLAPVKNSLYILRRVPPGGDQARRALEVIERQADQLTNLVNDLLDITRITSGKVQLQRRSLELNDLVRRTLEDHIGLFERSGVLTQLELEPWPVLIDADWSRVSQVVGNLLQNAAKFTPSGGSVRIAVSTDASRGQALIRVSDSGVGMAPRMLERLFEPFVQADDTLDRSQGGLGLGLALVKRLVELHGGSVEARSDGPGTGAEFLVRLPLAASVAGKAAPMESAISGTPRRRVLVIEDNVDAAESLRTLLELQGHQVALAFSGPDGLSLAREFRPEVVLCDIGLPGMDGYAIARAMRADEALESTRLIALSGYALPEDVQRAMAAGFEKHLAKPPSVEMLQAVLGSDI